MDLLNRLTEDMKAAMKSGQKQRLGVIRMLLNDVKNIDLDPKKPTAEQAVAAYGKKLRKSMEEFEKLGKAEQVEQLQSELAIVQEYVPKKASPEETATVIDAFLASNNFTEKQLGQAMGALMKAHGAQVDPGVANQLLRQKLAGR